MMESPENIPNIWFFNEVDYPNTKWTPSRKCPTDKRRVLFKFRIRGDKKKVLYVAHGYRLKDKTLVIPQVEDAIIFEYAEVKQ